MAVECRWRNEEVRVLGIWLERCCEDGSQGDDDLTVKGPLGDLSCVMSSCCCKLIKVSVRRESLSSWISCRVRFDRVTCLFGRSVW
eukprot:scaffold42771_cov206-Amphora_coffeaeformis.AAC.4